MVKTTYTVSIKHDLNHSKTYSYNSNIRVKIGDEVFLEQSNGSVAKGIVMKCMEGEGDFNGKVTHKVNRYKNKVHEYIADLIIKNAIRINPKVYEVYKFSTIGNQNTTYEQFKLKLARNIILSNGVKPSEYPNTVQLQYGSCKYFINLKTKTVTYMSNGHKVPKNWVKNKAYYKRLNVMLGIEADKVNKNGNKYTLDNLLKSCDEYNRTDIDLEWVNSEPVGQELI